MAKKEANPKKSAVGSILAFFAGITILVVAGLAAFHFFVGKPATAPLGRFADVLERVTQRKVQVTGSTVTLEQTGVSELAVIRRKTQSLIKYQTRWLASDNILIVRGEFLVKAGFDLGKVSEMELVEGEVEGVWPEAEILSVELVDYEVYFSENGTINKLQQKDQEHALKLLLAQAREDAGQSDLREEAQRRLRERLEDLGQGDFTLGEKFLP